MSLGLISSNIDRAYLIEIKLILTLNLTKNTAIYFKKDCDGHNLALFFFGKGEHSWVSQPHLKSIMFNVLNIFTFGLRSYNFDYESSYFVNNLSTATENYLYMI